MEDTNENQIENGDVNKVSPKPSKNQATNSPGAGSPHEKQHKFVRLPLARVKNMMKTDPDCGLISQDALVLVTKATEIFVDFLAKESVKSTCANKRKTVMRKDVDTAIDMVPQLCFLDGALE